MLNAVNPFNVNSMQRDNLWRVACSLWRADYLLWGHTMIIQLRSGTYVE